MTPLFNGWDELWRLAGCSSLLIFGMAWWRKGSEDEDRVMSEAADELIAGISDADVVNKIENETTFNIRDQMTLEEAEDWNRERELRRFKRRN